MVSIVINKICIIIKLLLLTAAIGRKLQTNEKLTTLVNKPRQIIIGASHSTKVSSDLTKTTTSVKLPSGKFKARIFQNWNQINSGPKHKFKYE